MPLARIQEARILPDGSQRWTPVQELRPGLPHTYFGQDRKPISVLVTPDGSVSMAKDRKRRTIRKETFMLPLGVESVMIDGEHEPVKGPITKRVVVDFNAPTPDAVDWNKIKSGATEQTDSKDFAGQKVEVTTHHGMEKMPNEESWR